MKLQLLYWLYGLTCTAAVLPLISTDTLLRLDSSNTDKKLANTVQASTDNTDFVTNYKNDTTSRLMELNNSSPETNDKENQQRIDEINPFETIVHEEQIYDVNKDKRGKRESFHNAEANENVENDYNSYLKNNVMQNKHHPFGHGKPPQHVPKESLRVLFPRKGYHSTIFGSSGQSEEDSPESMVLQILSSYQNENNDGLKNVGLTKTVAYNVTRLIDSNQRNNFLLEKKENLTVEMSYFDSQERETNYSNTQSSKLHKYLDLSHDYLINTSSNGKSAIAVGPNIQKGRSEFIDGNFSEVGYDSPSMGKRSQLVTRDENESDDPLGQPTGVNNIYSSTFMTETTMKDFQNLIENTILEKGYTENSITTQLEGSEYKGNLLDKDIKNSSDKTSSSQHSEELSTEGTSRLPYPEHILKSNSLGKNVGNKDLTEPWPKDRATTLSTSENKLNHSSYTLPLFVKHGESIVLEASNDGGVTDISLTNIQINGNPVQSSPAGDIGKQNYTNQLQAKGGFDKNKDIEEEYEGSGFDKYTQISILEKDTQTEEASTVTVVIKDEMETSGSEESDDSKTTNITELKDALSDKENDERNENGSDVYLQSKQPSDILLKEQKEPATEDITTIGYTAHTPVSSTEPYITDKVSTSGDHIFKSVEETSEDIVTGEYSNVDPSKIKLEENHSTASPQRGDTDIDIQGSILDNEIKGEDGRGLPTHEVELFGGQERGQRYNSNTELNNSKPNSVSDYNNTGLEESTEEPLTELCFPLTNENEVSLWDLISGKIYLEREGKKILLKLNNKPMNRCHSGTIKCKLPIDYENSNESVSGTGSLEGDVDEADSNYSAKVMKRHVIEDKSLEKREVDSVGHLPTEQKLTYNDQKEIIVSREIPMAKQISLTDLLLILLTNETSYNSGIKICDTQATSTKTAAEFTYPGQEIKQVHPTTDNEKNNQSSSTLISLLKKLGEDKNKQNVKTQNTTLLGISEGGGSGKRFKRTLVQQQDVEQEKEGGCGCGSMLGRTLPPIPNHDHFLGKRLNIITSIAHAIKDWAITRPTH